ncbi:glycosyltransferase family 8 protein [Ideonella sp.]|uniref:glycosyltransferase family 8 protein n=1 Tax=Ideonella sp. TaxID=1929293 RepID=UPI0035B4F1BA
MAAPRPGPTARQRARADAHRLMDEETQPGQGARAAGLIACDDGYDELAHWLLSRLPTAPQDLPVQVARQVLAWRRGEGGLLPAVTAALAIAPADAADAAVRRLLETAFACARPLEALDLLEWQAGSRPVTVPTALPGGAGGADSARWLSALRSMGEAVRGPGEPLADVAIVGLPDGHAPEPDDATGSGRGAAAWRRALTAPASRASPFARLLAPWRRPRLPSVLEACAGRLPAADPAQLVLLPGGELTVHTARHWLAALTHWPDVRISSLRVHDPAAGEPALVEALRRAGPVGAADGTSAWVLREWGVPCLPDPRPPGLDAHAPDGLWAAPDEAPAGRSWDALARALAGAPRAGVGAPALREAWAAWAARAGQATQVARQAAPARAPWPEPVDSAALCAPARTQQVLAAVGGADAAVVALAVDERLARHAEVVMHSALASSSVPLTFHLLTRGVQAPWLQRWARLLQDRAGLVWHRFDDVAYPGRLKLLAHTSVSTLDRLLLPELLPAQPRALYLDIDLVVLGDLAPLWQMDLRGQPLAARPSHSPGTRWGLQMLYQALAALPLPQALAWRQALHQAGPMGFRAFNAGVLVLDLERMRADQAAARCIALVERCAMNDQDALNAYARAAYLPLPTAWNAAPRQDVTAGAHIVHFVGPVKPWDEQLYVSRRPAFERVRADILHRLGEPPDA